MLLAFIAAVMDPAKAVEADGARQRVPGFALVQLGGGLPTELRRSAISTAAATMRSMTEGPGVMT